MTWSNITTENFYSVSQNMFSNSPKYLHSIRQGTSKIGGIWSSAGTVHSCHLEEDPKGHEKAVWDSMLRTEHLHRNPTLTLVHCTRFHQSLAENQCFYLVKWDNWVKIIMVVTWILNMNKMILFIFRGTPDTIYYTFEKVVSWFRGLTN